MSQQEKVEHKDNNDDYTTLHNIKHYHHEADCSCSTHCNLGDGSAYRSSITFSRPKKNYNNDEYIIKKNNNILLNISQILL